MPPPDRPAAVRRDIVLAWDRFSGWAHLARSRPGESRPRFVGFAHLPAATTGALRDRLSSIGCDVLTEYNIDDQLVELRLTVPGEAPTMREGTRATAGGA
jgi:hypothetical protein